MYKKFEETSKRIRKRSQQIKEKATALTATQPRRQADLLKELDCLGLFSSNGTPHVPLATDDSVFTCDNIPFARNTHFFGRTTELANIRAHLDDQCGLQSFRSFALYALVASVRPRQRSLTLTTKLILGWTLSCGTTARLACRLPEAFTTWRPCCSSMG